MQVTVEETTLSAITTMKVQQKNSQGTTNEDLTTEKTNGAGGQVVNAVVDQSGNVLNIITKTAPTMQRTNGNGSAQTNGDSVENGSKRRRGETETTLSTVNNMKTQPKSAYSMDRTSTIPLWNSQSSRGDITIF